MEKQEFVRSAIECGYDRFHPEYLLNNNLDSRTWFLELCLFQQWFRDIHFIDVEVKGIRYTGDLKSDHYQPNINGTCLYGLKKYNTYELALEAGLLEGLKLIK